MRRQFIVGAAVLAGVMGAPAYADSLYISPFPLQKDQSAHKSPALHIDPFPLQSDQPSPQVDVSPVPVIAPKPVPKQAPEPVVVKSQAKPDNENAQIRALNTKLSGYERDIKILAQQLASAQNTREALEREEVPKLRADLSRLEQ
ncbi:MAG: hypothetical protein ACPGRX_07490, partial [Bdellovibrionales bacterium]